MKHKKPLDIDVLEAEKPEAKRLKCEKKEESDNDHSSEEEDPKDSKEVKEIMEKTLPIASSVDLSRVREVVPSRKIKSGKSSPILFWMSRDQRVSDNWALLYAQELALKHGKPFIVLFNLTPTFLNASYRSWEFLLKGLEEIQATLKEYSIPFVLTRGDPTLEIPKFVLEHDVSAIVADFSPLKIYKQWKAELGKNTEIPIFEVDAHNIIPPWVISDKQEVGARTIRSKIHKRLDKYLVEFPTVSNGNSFPVWEAYKKQEPIDWKSIYEYYKTNCSLLGPDIAWLLPGEKAANSAVKAFLGNKLKYYNSRRNDPSLDGQSGLSPYLHFGQISAARIVLNAQSYKNLHKTDFESFIEELVVRRELSENYCLYNSNYDNFEGFANWAKETLRVHSSDKRDFVYNYDEWEKGETHDPLWNAAQLQTGKMHGYMRMYWGKKILEWSSSPQEAMRIAVELNDKYELDGRDPNGYVGVAWSIGGLHDQGWKERPVFGKIRYMNFAGCKRKFNVDSYIKKFLSIKK